MSEARDTERRHPIEPAPVRPAWEPMEIRRLGTISELVGGGGGKLSPMGDPGDGRKAPGLG